MYGAEVSECPACHVALADATPDEEPDPQADLVAVLQTTETGLLPLARMALEQVGIEYVIQNRGLADQIMGRRSSMTVGETDAPLVVLVREEDEARAIAVLSDLEGAPTLAAASNPSSPPAPRARSAAAAAAGDIEITDADTGLPLGTLTEAQLDSLAAHLELESSDDDDFYIDEATIAMLEEKGADTEAMAFLRRALAGRPDVTIRWRRG
jgi:hypothetical protein